MQNFDSHCFSGTVVKLIIIDEKYYYQCGSQVASLSSYVECYLSV